MKNGYEHEKLYNFTYIACIPALYFIHLSQGSTISLAGQYQSARYVLSP